LPELSHPTTMSSFKASNAFADPEDSKLVADAKQSPTEAVEYKYAEVRGYAPTLGQHCTNLIPIVLAGGHTL
jgi:hypothetical protein